MKSTYLQAAYQFILLGDCFECFVYILSVVVLYLFLNGPAVLRREFLAIVLAV